MTLKVELDGEKLTSCPLRLFLDQPADMAEIMWYHTNYRRGVMPVAGGLADQAALMIDIFRVIDSAIITIENAGTKTPTPSRGGSSKPRVKKGTRGERGPVKAKG